MKLVVMGWPARFASHGFQVKNDFTRRVVTS